MRLIAELKDDRVRGTFYIRDNAPIPVYGKGFSAVDVTDISPIPKAGWLLKNGKFKDEPLPEPKKVKPFKTTAIQKAVLKSGNDSSKINTIIEVLGLLD